MDRKWPIPTLQFSPTVYSFPTSPFYVYTCLFGFLVSCLEDVTPLQLACCNATEPHLLQNQGCHCYGRIDGIATIVGLGHTRLRLGNQSVTRTQSGASMPVMTTSTRQLTPISATAVDLVIAIHHPLIPCLLIAKRL
jgi:hypothetical protein